MAETEKKVVKKAAAPKKRAAGRDAYDDFLDAAEGKAAPKGTRKAEDSSKKKSTAVPAKKASTKAADSGVKKTASSSAKKTTVQKAAEKSEPRRRSDSSGQAAPKKRIQSSERPEMKKKADSSGRAAPRKKPAASGKTATKSTTGSSAQKTVRKEKTAEAKSVQGKHAAVLYVGNSDHDAFDDFLAETERTAPKKKHAKKKKKRASGATALLLLGIFAIIGLGAWRVSEYQTFRIMKAAVATETFYEGTTVDGVNISGMTLPEAVEHWEKNIEPAYSQRTVTLENGAAATAEQLGYSSDYLSVLSNAWAGGRRGTLEERYAAISSRSRAPVSYSVTRVPYSEADIARCAAAVAAQIDRAPQDAKIGTFNAETYAFTFDEAVAGVRLDQEALRRDIAAALDAGGGMISLQVEEIEPALERGDIESQYGMITYAVTNASSSSSNRLTNIRLALSSINGYCIKPGETFSFNEVVGKRTKDRGYKIATAYSGGEVTEDVGGGICQVSTTLFNAAVKADLEIVERHNHSLTVGYVDLGKDASVSWNSQDLRFKNNGTDSVYIVAVLTDDKRVRIGMFGRLLPNGESITVESRNAEPIDFEIIYQPSLSLAPGAMVVTQEGRNGYKAEAYKMRWDANGKRISKELLCRSTYKAINQIVEYGP